MTYLILMINYTNHLNLNFKAPSGGERKPPILPYCQLVAFHPLHPAHRDRCLHDISSCKIRKLLTLPGLSHMVRGREICRQGRGVHTQSEVSSLRQPKVVQYLWVLISLKQNLVFQLLFCPLLRVECQSELCNWILLQ